MVNFGDRGIVAVVDHLRRSVSLISGEDPTIPLADSLHYRVIELQRLRRSAHLLPLALEEIRLEPAVGHMWIFDAVALDLLV